MTDSDRDARRLWSRKVHGLTPYVPGEQPRDRAYIKLNTNENPYPPAPGVVEAIQTFPVERLKLYPDPTGHATRTALADYHGVTLEQVFVGNGSDEVLAMAFQAFFNHHVDPATASESEQIVFPDITYSFYPVYARLYDIPYRTVPLADDFTMPLERLKASCAGIVLANPNAPTGIAISLDDIRALADSDHDRLVLVDEAYVDFGGESAVALFDRIRQYSRHPDPVQVALPGWDAHRLCHRRSPLDPCPGTDPGFIQFLHTRQPRPDVCHCCFCRWPMV